MMSSYISTLAWTSPARAALPRLQADISKASVELSTGQKADIGLALGATTGESVSLHAARATIDAQTQSNAFAAGILGRVQTALGQIGDTANSFLQEVLTGQSGNASGAILAAQGQAALGTLTQSLNTSDGQRYLFAGTNSGTAPMGDYAGAPKSAVDAAFASAFGLSATDPQSDPKVANISAADMQSFLDTTFTNLFSDTAWSANWSAASSQPLTAGITQNSRVNLSASANDAPMRQLAMAFTMVGELGTANLSEAARKVVLNKAAAVLGTAVSGVIALSAGLGVSQQRVTAANTALAQAATLTDSRINTLEGVDPAEAKTRLDTLTTQLQMSYATTAKIMQLSIMNYV